MSSGLWGGAHHAICLCDAAEVELGGLLVSTLTVNHSLHLTARTAGRFFARYCPSSATELFSMCSRIPGQIEPVFS